MKHLLILLINFSFSFLCTSSVIGQICSDYPCVIIKVKKAIESKNYRLAFEQLESAENYPNKDGLEISGLRKQLFNAIDKEKTDAVKARDEADTQRSLVENQTKILNIEKKKSEDNEKRAVEQKQLSDSLKIIAEQNLEEILRNRDTIDRIQSILLAKQIALKSISLEKEKTIQKSILAALAYQIEKPFSTQVSNDVRNSMLLSLDAMGLKNEIQVDKGGVFSLDAIDNQNLILKTTDRYNIKFNLLNKEIEYKDNISDSEIYEYYTNRGLIDSIKNKDCFDIITNKYPSYCKDLKKNIIVPLNNLFYLIVLGNNKGELYFFLFDDRQKVIVKEKRINYIHSGIMSSITVSPNKQLLAITSFDSKLSIWHIEGLFDEKYTPIILPQLKSWPLSSCFSQDNQNLIIGCKNGFLVFFDIDDTLIYSQCSKYLSEPYLSQLKEEIFALSDNNPLIIKLVNKIVKK